MALIERDGKVYARKLWIFMGPREWGNDLMRQVAREAFASDTSLDAVQVNEHAGWHLTFLRDGTIVGTANDQAHLDDKATEFLNSIYGYDSAGEIRRPLTPPGEVGGSTYASLHPATNASSSVPLSGTPTSTKPTPNGSTPTSERAISGRSRRIRPTADSLK